MIIRRGDKVNLEKILEKYKKVECGFLKDLELGYPNIGRKWNLEDELNIQPEDLKNIKLKIKEKYQGKYDLILYNPRILDRVNRLAEISFEAYKRKKEKD